MDAPRRRLSAAAGGLLAVALSVAAGVAGSGWAVVLRPVQDLSISAPDVRLHGRAAGARGRATAIGDFDGDGVGDLAVGFWNAAGPADARPGAGEVVIAFGGADLSGEIDALSWSGDSCVVYGRDAGDYAGGSLAAGDLDGDGVDDLVIGCEGGDGPADDRGAAGEAAVLFGGAALRGAVDLRGYAGDSLVVYGRDANDGAAGVLALSVADLDGDAAADLAVGFGGGDGPADGRADAGEVAVVLAAGARRGALDLRSAADTAVVYGRDDDDGVQGLALAAGDLDGDGTADLVVGLGGGDGPADDRSNAGEAAVVFGGAAFGGAVDLRTWAGGTAFVHGRDAGDGAAGLVLAVGDPDGDGAAELVVGFARGDGPAGDRADAGEAAIVSAAGLAGEVDLRTAAPEATVYGVAASDGLFGFGVALLDLDGDGVDDLAAAFGGGDGPADARAGAGDVVVVSGGSALTGTIDLASWTGETTVLHGADAADASEGITLAAGDVDGDGIADLAIGFGGGDGPANARALAGEAALVRGAFPAVATAPVETTVVPAETTAAVAVRAATRETFVQVNLTRGGSTAAPVAASVNASGAGANYAVSFPLLETGDTATLYLWTSLPRAGLLLGLRSDSASLDPHVLPRGVSFTSDTARRAFAASAVAVEFLDSAGAVVGDTRTTTVLGETLAYTLCWDLSEATTGRWAAAGFDTSAGSAAFGFWIADTYGGPWRSSATPVSALAGGRSMRLCAAGVTTDLPGGLGGAVRGVTPLAGGGTCLFEAAGLPAGFLRPLRAARDRALGSSLGRFLVLVWRRFLKYESVCFYVLSWVR